MTLKNARIYQELLRRLPYAEEARSCTTAARNTRVFASTDARVPERSRLIHGDRSAQRTWQGRE